MPIILLLNGPSRTKPWRPMVGNKQPHQHSHCNHNCNHNCNHRQQSSRYHAIFHFSKYRQDTKLSNPRTDGLDALGIRYPLESVSNLEMARLFASVVCGGQGRRASCCHLDCCLDSASDQGGVVVYTETQMILGRGLSNLLLMARSLHAPI
jgi:hypothetical protein